MSSDEEGDEEVRRRERDLGIVPTSPASLLGLLQIASPPHSVSPVGGPSDLHQPQMPQYPQGEILARFALSCSLWSHRSMLYF